MRHWTCLQRLTANSLTVKRGKIYSSKIQINLKTATSYVLGIRNYASCIIDVALKIWIIQKQLF